MVHGTYSSKCLFKVLRVPWKLGSFYNWYWKWVKSCWGRLEEASLFKVQQEKLRDETGQHCQVCVQISATRRGRGTSYSISFHRVRCTGHREMKMGLVSPEFCSLSFLKLENQPHLKRDTPAPKFLPSKLCHSTKTVTKCVCSRGWEIWRFLCTRKFKIYNHLRVFLTVEK